jgi:hypothetical protein
VGAWPAGTPIGNPVLAQNASAISVGAVTTNQTLATITIPAGRLSVGDSIEVTYIWSANNNANSKSPNLYINGTVGPVQNDSLANNQYLQKIVIFKVVSSVLLRCVSLANSSYTSTSGNPSNCTVNIANAITIDFKGQKAVAGDTLTLEHYAVKIIKA